MMDIFYSIQGDKIGIFHFFMEKYDLCFIIEKEPILKVPLMKITFTVLLVIAPLMGVISCQSGGEVTVSPQEMAEFSIKLRQADELYSKGTYASLKTALSAYQDLSAFPAFSMKIKEKMVRTALLLSLRAKELAVLDTSFLETADRLILTHPSLKAYKPYLDASKALPNSSRGANMSDAGGDTDLDEYYDWMADHISSLFQEFQKNAPISPFHAYFYISLYESFRHWINEEGDFARISVSFRQSPLVRYKLALYPEVLAEVLSVLKEEDPDFVECDYALGEHSLRQGKILTAERYLLKSFRAIPESTALVMALTKVYFALEEYEKCLELNELALQTAPVYRDALLGKMICLSFMNRPEDAIRICSKLLDLGNYYMGEAHYWRARNLNELMRLEEAWEDVEKAKKYLIGHHEVLFLSGLIAFRQNNLDLAESNLRETLKLNGGYCEASYYLGQIYSRQERWEESGAAFQRSALCCRNQEASLREKIKEIEESALSRERKAKQVDRKKKQLVQIRLSKATSYFNGAASLYNAENFMKARTMAEKAAEHPNFKKQAADLLERIKQSIH
jgi:tetratricopeptide (TPR) repeat protein